MFTGKYFNGKTSTGIDAVMHLNSQNIEIVYADEHGQNTSIIWELNQIHPNDINDRGKVILKYGDNFPYQYFESDAAGIMQSIRETYPSHRFSKSTYGFVFKGGAKALVILAVVALAGLALAYFVVIPGIAEGFAAKMPQHWETEIGESSYAKMVDESTIDEEKTKLINQYFKQLNFKSTYDVKITVVNEDVVNAYALPGGRIVVYEGILKGMDSQEELAALLAHEFSHVQLRHSTRAIFRQLSNYLFISVLFGDASGITAVIVDNANNLKNLGFSRKLEQDADKNGLALLKQQHVNPQGMVDLFEELQKEEGEISENLKFLSTHPLTKERIAYIKGEIKKKDYTINDQPQLDSLFTQIKESIE
jgi:predicted Zn-dependent protease